MCTNAYPVVCAESGSLSTLYRTCQSDALETFQNTLSFLLIKVRVIGCIVRNCKVLFVNTHNIYKTCFYKIKKKKQFRFWAGALLKNWNSEYLPHWLDKNSIYRKLLITTLKRNNLNQKQKLFHFKFLKMHFSLKAHPVRRWRVRIIIKCMDDPKCSFSRSIGNFLVTPRASTASWCSAWSTVTCMLMRAYMHCLAYCVGDV